MCRLDIQLEAPEETFPLFTPFFGPKETRA